MNGKPLQDISSIENPDPGDLASRISGKNKSGTARRIPVIFWPCQSCGHPRWVGLAHHEYWSRNTGPRDFCFKCAMAKRSGINHHHWKGGRTSYLGYIYVRLQEDNPFFGMTNSSHWVGEHRLIMAQNLGRFLRSDEFVHHKNGNRSDNQEENLELTTNEEHCRIHKPEQSRRIEMD